MAAAAIDVVVLQEHGRRQHDVGELCRVGHELLMHAHEKVVAPHALDHQPLLGADIGRIGILDKQRRHRRPAIERVRMVHQDGTDARLVEVANARITQTVALKLRLVEREYAGVRMERPAALVLPAARDGGDRQRRVHIRRAISLAREPVAKPEEGALRRADQPRERLYLVNRQPGDRRRPVRRARPQMLLEPLRIIGVSLQIVAVGQAVAEQNMHDRAGQRAVGSGLQDQANVGLFHRGVVVDVDDDDSRAAFLAGTHRMRHHIDLGDDGVRAPDHDAVRLRHLARVRPGEFSGAHHPAGPGEIGADRVEEAGIFLCVTQPVDAVALHQAHRAGIVVGPHRLAAVLFLGCLELLRHEVECCLPACLLPGALPLGSGPHQRLQQAARMVDALGIARDLRANDARRVGIILGAVDAADRTIVDQFDIERAGRGAVMRAGRMTDAHLGSRNAGVLVHAASLKQRARI